ncbi:hypothetical protein FDA94_13415 [Herbidospora galbida]|uniref:Uncharacterized protein n=1 Tax=Herbidospora galbida TaxID=2575442 RepID=A0A4U3ML19_9ACTN|nr:hypothetical protein [Herbidospora galbida]TKK88656.1 hypothetical protein FDA94_13415 [Herbidospora galbida]
MTDRIEAAAAELRPLLQEFLLWVPANAPESDPDLVGSAALWHRLSQRSDVGHWRRDDLRPLMLDRLPQVVEDPDAAADAMVPSLRSYLTFLHETGRLTAASDRLELLLNELDALEDDFVDRMEDAIGETEWDDEEDGEEDEGLGDFEPFADELAELPTLRLRPDAELAADARRVPLITAARDLSVWIGTDRKVGQSTLLTDAEVEEAVTALGLTGPQKLWNLWNLAIDLEFVTPSGEDTVSIDSDTAAWPFDDDEDVLDAWMLGLGSIDYGDPELDDDDLTVALSGLTRETLIRVLLSGGQKALDDLREELAEAVRDYDDLGDAAWEAAGDPLVPVLDWLTGYGMAEVEGDTVQLTSLGTEGVVHLVDEADLDIDARPAIDAMTAHDLLSFSADMSEEEADAEFAAWMRLREPAQAAEELLGAAVEDESDALVRVQAASLVGQLGEVAIPAWKKALNEESLRSYAATHLTQLEVDDAPEPTQADTHWLILDMWTISAGLGRAEFVSSLEDIGPATDLISLLEVIWKVRHPHLDELLEAIAEAHPDRNVGKAAKRALFKARSGD